MQEAIILLVEGRSAGGHSLAPALRKAGFDLNVVHSGVAAFNLIQEFCPDLVVYDASSMRSSGTRTCRRLRRAMGETPIIHSRAAKTPEDRTAEADVYLVHPYTPRKLLNRIKALP